MNEETPVKVEIKNIIKVTETTSWYDLTPGMWIPIKRLNKLNVATIDCVVIVADDGTKIFVNNNGIQNAIGWEDYSFIPFSGEVVLKS